MQGSGLPSAPCSPLRRHRQTSLFSSLPGILPFHGWKPDRMPASALQNEPTHGSASPLPRVQHQEPRCLSDWWCHTGGVRVVTNPKSGSSCQAPGAALPDANLDHAERCSTPGAQRPPLCKHCLAGISPVSHCLTLTGCPRADGLSEPAGAHTGEMPASSTMLCLCLPACSAGMLLWHSMCPNCRTPQAASHTAVLDHAKKSASQERSIRPRVRLCLTQSC